MDKVFHIYHGRTCQLSNYYCVSVLKNVDINLVYLLYVRTSKAGITQW